MRNYERLFGIPRHMSPWNMRLKNPHPSKYGEYVLVGVEQAGQELHHEVEVVDESGFPMSGVWVIFGFPAGGPSINLPTTENHWPDAPAILKGNAQKTTVSGFVKHTFASGGEDIWIWDVSPSGVLKLPSTIVYNCTSQRTPVGHFEHTGVRLTFQRRTVGGSSIWERIERVEKAVEMLKDE